MSKYGQGRGGRPWRRLRDKVLLRDNYTCQSCNRLFLPEQLECDHIVPTSRNGTDDELNLQALCLDCHSQKSAREAGGKAKVRINIDGWPA